MTYTETVQKIPQVLPWIGTEEAEAVFATIEENWITEGSRSKEFSAQLNQRMNVPYGVFAPNGTLALYLGLLALGIGAGDEVLVPDCTFIGSANAVLMTGAMPIFVEVNRYNFQIDITKAEHLINERSRAIMPVHLFGMTANMREVMEFAQKHNLKVIEDAAQAIGVHYQDQHAGTFGDIGCFSFFADKTITTGEGGYVVCRDPEVYERLMLLRNQGRWDRGSFVHPEIGFNFRITDMQAAIGLVQLAKLDSIIERKLRILDWYYQRLVNLENVSFLTVEPGSSFVPFRAALVCDRAHELMEFLTTQNVQCRTFFYPLHKQPCFARFDRKQGGVLNLSDAAYPNSVYGFDQGVSLPIFPTLTEAQVDYLCDRIRQFYRR